MQTDVIKLIFAEFEDNFSFFFGPCDRGFTNEAIIKLYSRCYRPQPNGRQKLVEAQYKVMEIYFTLEGAFGIFNPKLKPWKGQPQADEQPAVLLPRHTVFGDYQLLFDLYPRMEFCPFSPGQCTSKANMKELGADGKVSEWRAMCLAAEDFEELCELYPDTAESLKVQGLMKRKMFMK